MAKSSRSSTKKHNNQRKASSIYGPAESARAERLSARLLQSAMQPKPESSDVNMDANDDAEEGTSKDQDKSKKGDENAMEVDTSSKPSKYKISKKRIDKKRQKKSGIVFPKYSDRIARKKKGGK